MASKSSPVSVCARWLETALGPNVTGAASAASRTSEPVYELRSRLLLLDSLKPEDLTATLADGRLLRLLRRRLLRSRHTSSLLMDCGDLDPDADDDANSEANDNDDDGEEASRRRVSRFLDSCRTEFHLPAEYLFQTGDLLPEPGGEGNPERVLRCLQALSQSDMVAAAGFASDAVLPMAVEEVTVTVAEKNYSAAETYAKVRWDAQVLDELEHQVSFFRACCTLARQLRESPLSLWPRDAVGAVFGRSADLLELLTGLRACLRSDEEELDDALKKREEQLVKLYAGLWWHMILSGNQKLKELDNSCLAQVTLALGKLPQAVESAAKCAMDLQQMPKAHLRRLKTVVEKAMEPTGETSDARQRLQASVEVLNRVEERVNRCLVNTNKYLAPSCAEFEKLSWPPQLQFRPKSPTELGRLRRSGALIGPEGKRLHASLWDGALVLSQSGEVLHALKIGPDATFEEVVGKALALTKRTFSFRLAVGGSSSEALMLNCESTADRQEWQKAFNRAHGVWNPDGFNKHGHRFSRTAASPDVRPPPDTCRHCVRPLGCWAHRCERCKAWLHRRCVTAACCPTDPQQHLRCQPMAPPRRNRQSTSSQKQQKPQQQQQNAQNWSEPAPIDAETARVRIRQLPETQPGRRRNFLLCPTSEPAAATAAAAAAAAAAREGGYQLHVLSGEAVFTYRVDSSSEPRMLRIAGACNSFPDLKNLVRHYESNPLPPPQDDEDVYELIEPVPERLMLDSGVADC